MIGGHTLTAPGRQQQDRPIREAMEKVAKQFLGGLVRLMKVVKE